MSKITQRGDSYQYQHANADGRVRRSFKTEEDAELFKRLFLGHLDKGEQIKDAERSAIADIKAQPATTANASVPFDLAELAEIVKVRHWAKLKSAHEMYRVADAVVTMIGGATPIRTISTSHRDVMVDTLTDRKRSNATINRHLASLSKMLRYAHERQWIDHTPHIGFLKESNGRTYWLRPGEEDNIVRWYMHRGYKHEGDFLVFLLDTGVRFSTGTAYQWRNDTPSLIVVTGDIDKSGRPRSIPKTSRVHDILDRWRDQPTGPFARITKNRFRHLWDRMKADLGYADNKEFVPHILRHSFASRLVSAGVSIPATQQLMGHNDIKMTMRYAHLCPTTFANDIAHLEQYNATPHAPVVELADTHGLGSCAERRAGSTPAGGIDTKTHSMSQPHLVAS